MKGGEYHVEQVFKCFKEKQKQYMLIYIHIEDHEYSLIFFFFAYISNKIIRMKQINLSRFFFSHETTGKLMIEANLFGLYSSP